MLLLFGGFKKQLIFKNINYYKFKKIGHSQNKAKKRKILHISAIILIFLIKAVLILKELIVFLATMIYKPLRSFFKLLFYKLIIRTYGFYLAFSKRMGWQNPINGFVAFVFSQKLVHVFVFITVLSLIFVNLSSKTRAYDLSVGAQDTILADLIKSDFSVTEEDEQLIVETFDREADISAVQQSYLDNLSAFRPQPRVTVNAESEESEETLTTTQDGASIVKPEIASTRITKRLREGNVNYTVRTGDTISTIAEEFEIGVSTILWENGLNAYSIIRPGDSLVILPSSGLTHKVASGDTIGKIAVKYKIEEESLRAANKLAADAKLAIGEKLFVPGGKKTTYVQSTPKTYTGFSAIKDLVKAPSAAPVAGNKMNWPTEGHRITQYYSWNHYAVDIGNKTGTPLYAADSGVIEVVGWGTGYGNQVLIDHDGGKKTRYAHLSKFYVKKGDKVTKGQTIGEMGSTGWSTGPHLHFEVIINGKKQNPLNYIK